LQQPSKREKKENCRLDYVPSAETPREKGARANSETFQSLVGPVEKKIRRVLETGHRARCVKPGKVEES